VSITSSIEAASFGADACFSPSSPACVSSGPRVAVSRAVRSIGMIGGPGSSSSGMPALRIFVPNDVMPSSPMSSSEKPNTSV
jgi:hypothetical protein